MALLFLLILFLFPVSGFSLLSLEEEEKIGKEVLQEVTKELILVNDLEISAYVRGLGKFLLLKGASFSPFNFRFFVIKEKTFNGFSVPGGYIFLNTGLFDYVESEDELAGIIAHEMAHNLSRHVAKRIETAKKMQVAPIAVTLASLLLGGSKLGQIVGATSTALAQTKFLAYSRADEEEADRIAFEILTKSDFNPQAIVRVFQRLAQESPLSVELNYRYLLTHPPSYERTLYLQNLAEKTKIPYKKDFYTFSQDPYYFQRIKIRTKVLTEETGDLILQLKLQLKEREDPWLHYQLAMAFAQARFFDLAEEEFNKALSLFPPKEYFKLDLGEIYFLKGDYPKALVILKELNFSKYSLYEILESKRDYLLARSYLEIGNLKESYQLFKALEENGLVNQDSFFYYYFGILCSRKELLGEAHYYFAKHYETKGDFKTALFHYKRALSFLEKTSKMYLEAEKKIKVYEEKKN